MRARLGYAHGHGMLRTQGYATTAMIGGTASDSSYSSRVQVSTRYSIVVAFLGSVTVYSDMTSANGQYRAEAQIC